MNKLFKRDDYLKRLRGFYHQTDIIKVITGVRRSGKSCLMETIKDELISDGINLKNVIFLDLDSKPYHKLKTADELEYLIDSFKVDEGTIYLFIDEIQNIKNFETLINAYRNSNKFSIFLTGSNSYLLSGELVTKLTGRYIEIELFPLTFEEYIKMKKFYNKYVDSNINNELRNYIYEGGFPKTIFFDNLMDKRTYVSNLIKEIFDKDIKRRVKINNTSNFSKIQTYIINNFGSPTNIDNIKKEFEKKNIFIKRETIKRYIDILIDAKIIYKCRRFDLKTKKSINGEEKYYLSDLSFYFLTNTDNRINYGPTLENIVFTYASSKNYSISIGKIGNLECDFILRDTELNYSYVQVSMTILNSIDTENREYKVLESIKDNYPKYVLTTDTLLQKRNGIIHDNICNFMINSKLFNGI